MALAERELKHHRVLTYQDYLSEGETPGRYEIIDGVRENMTGTSPEHNDIVDQIALLFREYQRTSGKGRKLSSPLDIITKHNPLKVRQPDVSLISWERWSNRNQRIPSPLSKPPELVVEVLSPSETKRSINIKMQEYADVDVKECWLVRPIESTIELWSLSSEGVKLIGTYTLVDKLVSLAFSDLIIDVSSVFDI